MCVRNLIILSHTYLYLQRETERCVCLSLSLVRYPSLSLSLSRASLTISRVSQYLARYVQARANAVVDGAAAARAAAKVLVLLGRGASRNRRAFAGARVSQKREIFLKSFFWVLFRGFQKSATRDSLKKKKRVGPQDARTVCSFACV